MSEIRASIISDAAGTGPIYLHKQSAAKGWVNFIGQGTIAFRGSVNVSSLTDNGTGRYTVDFSNAFGSADNYTFNFNFGTTANATVNSARAVSGNITAFSVGCEVGNFQAGATNGYNDVEYVTGLFHGDLA